MAYFYFSGFMHRTIIPIIITACVMFRPCGLSGIYLIFLLYIPFVPVPTPKSLKGHTKRFLEVMLAISILITIAQLTFQIVLLTTGEEYGSWLPYCSTLERAFRTAGFIRLDSISVQDAMTWLSPDVVMLVTTFTYFLGAVKFAVRSNTVEGAEHGTSQSEELINVVAPNMSNGAKKILGSLGRYLSLSLLCLAAILRPSIPGGVYFIAFLASATWWGCYKQLNRAFVYLIRGVLVLLFVHIIALYLYQLQWLQELLSGDNRWARYFGLTPLLTTECKDPRTFTFVNAEWPSYVNPIALTCLYHVITITSKNLLKLQLIRGVSPSSRKYGTGTRTSLIAEGTSGGGEAHDDIPMHPLGKGTVEKEYVTTPCEQILFCLASTFDLIIRSSYIATNIIMMVWSITYHSWLTFVLLLWSNIMWMLPNQRRSMLRSTPVLVFYAEFLLIAQYIFGMNLTDEELPAKVKGFDLAQFGFEKVTEMPCIPLLVKCLYTTMFWITLRQFMKERKEAKQTSTLADMVAPLQVTVSTATTAMGQEEEAKQNKTMEKIGRFVKRTLTTYWICVVAIMLFVSGITGTHMTGFRIVYMALFLVFIIAFQLSWTAWRRMMYGFWAVVIIYSMVILILVYTYQFNNFDDYWLKYLHIPIQIQNDIGLEKYETKQLFVRLLTPTFFVVITVIQMHYFHQDFLALSDIGTRRRSSVANTAVNVEARSDIRSDTSSAQMGLWEQKTQAEQKKLAEIATAAATEKDSKVKGKKKSGFVKRLALGWKHISYFFDLVWLFFELHLLKVVIVFGTFLCIFDPCAAHFPIMVMCVIVLACGSKAQNCIKHVVAILCSVLLLFNMIYQIEYIKHEQWNVQCSEDANNTKELNGAEWLGFKKTKFELPYQLRWYIVYLVAASAHVVVTMRQLLWRLSTDQRPVRPYVMFPEITRNDADKNVLSCVKFLVNYGFYKFGYEMTLMAIVALVGIRMDVYAVLYALWLIVFIRMTRKQAAAVWPFFIAFVIVVLPIQYVMVIGLPPWLCITFPWELKWEKLDMHELQDWLYLLNAWNPPPANKLVCDVIVLTMAARQAVVFRIERRFDNVPDTGHGTSRYPGGANARLQLTDDIYHVENPVPDFVTYIRSWLDIAKRCIFLSFLWVTLAVVFLAGTNRVNVFSIGYLVGSFIFLWLGSDLYLRPIPKIISYWNCLLCYNVFVIIVKVLLQIPGCIFLGIIQEHACWAVQLFAIGCINKFGDGTPDRPANAYIEGPTCTVPHADVGLFWDGICFGFLILQKRLFMSYYFLHMIDDTKAITILASRGAELIEELRQQQIEEQQVEENNILEKIKAKMDRIKANQQRIQGPGYTESTNHYVDTIFAPDRPMYRRRQPRSYKEAIRSGDYYMFDSYDDEEIDFEINQKGKEKLTEEEEMITRRAQPVGEYSRQPTDKLPTVPSGDILDLHKIPDDKTGEDKKGSGGGKRPARDDDDDDDPMSTLSAITEPKTEEETWKSKLMVYLYFIWAFLESCMISFTIFLNKFSKDYRYVIRVLTKEKKYLKDKGTFRIGVRRGSGQVWHPIPATYQILKRRSTEKFSAKEEPTVGEIGGRRLSSTSLVSLDSDNIGRKPSVLTIPEIRLIAPSIERGLDVDRYEQISESPALLEELQQTEMSSEDQAPIVLMFLSIWYYILAHSDVVCYFMVFLNQIKSASVISLPLPMMVFLWGSLTIPRPTKTFWVTVIAYTEVIVIIKCVFQFELLPWNNNVPSQGTPFFPAKIIGIERKPNYATYDLILLLIVFFHRFMLKSLGLWKSSFDIDANLHEGEYKLEQNSLLVLTKTHDEADSGSKQESSMSIRTPGGHRLTSLSSAVHEENERSGATKSAVATTSGYSGRPPDDADKDVGPDNISVTESMEKLVVVKMESLEESENYPVMLNLATSRYFESTRLFFTHLLDPTSRVTTDVYAYMFICDFFNFLVTFFGFSAFGSQIGDGGVSAYLKENKVPIPFLMMLILQFMLIIIDRGLYLRKYILGKVVFQYFLIFGVHIWMFFVLPGVTERPFNALLPPQMWYMVKCFYLLLSAYQIRSGYPTRILGNFLCKGYNYVNMALFKGFMLVPFLFELRTIMDWMWTDTSMAIFDWLKMEDIFAHVFQVKCARYVEEEFPAQRGEKKPGWIKYLMGGCGLFAIVAIIWFPLVLFALGSTVGQSNLPYDVTLNIRIGPYQPIFSMSAQNNSIFRFTEKELSVMRSIYQPIREADTFLVDYEYTDVAAVKLNCNSTSIWTISPPDQIRLIEEINSTRLIVIHMEYIISRVTTNKENPGVITEQLEVVLPPTIDGQPNKVREELAQMLQEKNAMLPPVLIRHLLPKFIKVTNIGTAKPVPQLMLPLPSSEDRLYRNITFKLSKSEEADKSWWEVREDCSGSNYDRFLRKLPYKDCDYLVMYTFNEKTFPASLSVFSGGGIIGLYTTLVFVASRVFRGIFSDIFHKIMFEDMPNIDRVLQLCLDIYLVREAKELCLEEDLFAKLVFLFRSPETMIKWTRPKEIGETDDDDPEQLDGNDRRPE